MLSISEAIKGVSDAVIYYMKEGKEAYYLAGIGQVAAIAGSRRRLARAVDKREPPDGLVGRFVDLIAGSLQGIQLDLLPELLAEPRGAGVVGQ